MRTLIFLSFLIITALPSTAQEFTGFWKTYDDKTGDATSIIKIYEEKGALFGKVDEILDPDDQNSVCEKCSGENKNQPVLGMVIIQDLKKKEDRYTGGTILDPTNGKTYKVTLTLDQPDRLRVRGYLGVSLLGRTQYWQRVK